MMQETQTRLLKLEFGLLVIPLLFLGAVFLEQVVGTSFLMNLLYPWTAQSLPGKVMDMLTILAPVTVFLLSLLSLVRVQWDFSADTLLTISIRRASTWQYLVLVV